MEILRPTTIGQDLQLMGHQVEQLVRIGHRRDQPALLATTTLMVIPIGRIMDRYRVPQFPGFCVLMVSEERRRETSIGLAAKIDD